VDRIWSVRHWICVLHRVSAIVVFSLLFGTEAVWCRLMVGPVDIIDCLITCDHHKQSTAPDGEHAADSGPRAHCHASGPGLLACSHNDRSNGR